MDEGEEPGSIYLYSFPEMNYLSSMDSYVQDSSETLGYFIDITINLTPGTDLEMYRNREYKAKSRETEMGTEPKTGFDKAKETLDHDEKPNLQI
jgi:hypothetical protein